MVGQTTMYLVSLESSLKMQENGDYFVLIDRVCICTHWMRVIIFCQMLLRWTTKFYFYQCHPGRQTASQTDKDTRECVGVIKMIHVQGW